MEDLSVVVLAADDLRVHGRPRQLLTLGGEVVLERILRQVAERGHEAVVATHMPEVQAISPRWFAPERREDGYAGMLSTEELWTERTVVLFSDVWYTDEAMGKVFAVRDPLRVLGKWTELFGFVFHESEAGRMKKALAQRCHLDWQWCVYRALCGLDVSPWKKDDELFLWLTDCHDFDNLAEYENLRRLLGG